MVKVSEVKNGYFQHDFFPQGDKKILHLLDELSYEGYGLFWKIVEFMHTNELAVGEERFVCGKEFEAKVKKILTEFQLFRIEDNKYISDRILRNISAQEEKKQKAATAANTRWQLSKFKEIYKEIFETEPVLSDKVIAAIRKMSSKVNNFESILPDVLYTMKCLKFDNNPEFKPSIDWLFEGKNFTQMLNGGYGDMRSWSDHKAFLARKKAEAENQGKEVTVDLETIVNKIDAINFIKSKIPKISTTKLLPPEMRKLAKKFDITLNDLRGEKNGI